MIKTQTIDLLWQKSDVTVFLPVMLSIICFIVYWFIAQSEQIKSFFYNKYTYNQASVRHITFNRLTGFFAMGIIPAIICLLFLPEFNLTSYGLAYIPETIVFTLIWTLGLSIPIIPLVYISARKPKNLVNYPQIRTTVWTLKIVLLNIFGWSVYLFGYEFLFRGILLIPLVATIGVWPAIAINTALYSATHIPKGLDETIGAIPFGIVLCLLTLLSGTIWIAFIVHLVMALTNSFTALKFHPDINYTNARQELN